MLKRGTSVVLLTIAFLIFSCAEKKQLEVDDIYQEYVDEQFNNYSHIYSAINDTINNWISDSLGITLSIREHPWQVDSAIIFNKDSSRLFTTINSTNEGWKHAKVDYVEEFGGAYIDNEWYYYFIPVSMPVSRLLYKDGLYKPFTFDQLSYIAHKRRFGSSLRREESGTIVVNEKFFKKKFFNATQGHPRGSERIYRDSVVLSIWKQNRGKLKPGRIEEIKAEMAASVRPPEPVEEVKERSWWDKMFGEPEQPKLFESDAWKNRRNKPK